MSEPGHNSIPMLKEFANRIFNMDKQIKQSIEDNVKPLRDDKKTIFGEAEANGFDKVALRETVRKMHMCELLREEIKLYESTVLYDFMS